MADAVPSHPSRLDPACRLGLAAFCEKRASDKKRHLLRLQFHHLPVPSPPPCCPDRPSDLCEPQLPSGPLPGPRCAPTPLPLRLKTSSPPSPSMASAAPMPLLWYDTPIDARRRGSVVSRGILDIPGQLEHGRRLWEGDARWTDA